MRTGAPRHANYQPEHSSLPSAVTNCYCAHPSTTSHDLHVYIDGSSCSYGLFEVWSKSAIGEMLVQIYCFGIQIIQSTSCTNSQLKASQSALYYQEENQMNQTEMSDWICWRRSVDKKNRAYKDTEHQGCLGMCVCVRTVSCWNKSIGGVLEGSPPCCVQKTCQHDRSPVISERWGSYSDQLWHVTGDWPARLLTDTFFVFLQWNERLKMTCGLTYPWRYLWVLEQTELVMSLGSTWL